MWECIKLTNYVVADCPVCIWIRVLWCWLSCLCRWKISISIFSLSLGVIASRPIGCCCGFSNRTSVCRCIISTLWIWGLVLIFILHVRVLVCWWRWRVLLWLSLCIQRRCRPRVIWILDARCLWVWANRLLLILFVVSTHLLFWSRKWIIFYYLL